MAQVQCSECSRSYAIGRYPLGCPSCAATGTIGLLEATYEYDGALLGSLQEALDRRPRSLWRFASLLPLPPDSQRVELGEGGTPLIASPWLDDGHQLKIYLKNETANPTWSFKDRGNTVTVSVARALGAPGIAAVTTGNHGVSAAAYAARAGLPSTILCSPHSDIVHRAMIAMYGGTAIVVEDGQSILTHLVQEQGWLPSTSLGDLIAPNPFGAEGHKTIAYEVFEDLAIVPDAVVVPVSSGDLFYGIYKGFRELVELGLAQSCPRIVACQAEGAAPLAAAFRAQTATVPVLDKPTTVATSIGDATSGRQALRAIVESGGDVVTIDDEHILAAQLRLARAGFLVEPASAAAIAGLEQGARAGILRRGERVVCVLTGAAIKWSAQLVSAAMDSVLMEPSLTTVAELVARMTASASRVDFEPSG